MTQKEYINKVQEEAKILYKKYHRKYIYLTAHDIVKVLKRIDMYESLDSECDLEDKLKRQNDRNEWYDSWD